MITLVHTSDWHIGKAFSGFEPDVPGVLRQARLDGIDRIAGVAMAEGAAHVLVAGDTFDQSSLPDRLLRTVLSRLAATPQLTWHLIPGNHDPDQPGGIFDRLAGLGTPANVRLHRSAQAVEIAPRVALLPAPLKAKASAIDPTRWMDDAATPEGTLRIGLAHGGTQDFSSLSRRAAATAEPISPARAKSAGLAYLALGDWHGCKEIAPGTWYSGTHEPDLFATNDRGSVMVARFDGTRLVSVDAKPVRHFTWTELDLTVSGAEDLAPVDRVLNETADARRRLVLRVALTGACTLDEIGRIEQRLEAVAGNVFALETDLGGLSAVTSADALAAFDDRRLSRIAARLAEASATDGTGAASGALRLLHRMAAIERQGPAAGSERTS